MTTPTPLYAPDARLLSVLRESSQHRTVAELAAELPGTAADVAGRIAVLRSAGFDIEAHPALGYRLVGTPDRLIADDLKARLGSCDLVREILVFATTASTNDVAARAGQGGAAGGLAIIAEEQTAGRGRFSRPWASAAHRGLWFSLLARPRLPVALWPRLGTWAAVAVAASVDRVLGARQAAIKWPNDVEVDGRKVAGILIETGYDAEQSAFAVIGIGVNLNHAPEDFPPDLVATAGSLRMISGQVTDRSAFAVTLLRELGRREKSLADDFPALVEEATARSTVLGRWIEVRAGANHQLSGMAESLDEGGRLVLRSADGQLHALHAGEVTLRPGT